MTTIHYTFQLDDPVKHWSTLVKWDNYCLEYIQALCGFSNTCSYIIMSYTSYCYCYDISSLVISVHLRTVSALLVRAWLVATYHACLWSIRACTVMSPDSSHIQATAARPHHCKNRAKYVSQRVPTLFSGEFHKLNDETLTLVMIVNDLSRRLFIATFVFQLCASHQKCWNGIFYEYLLTIMLFAKSPRGE